MVFLFLSAVPLPARTSAPAGSDIIFSENEAEEKGKSEMKSRRMDVFHTSTAVHTKALAMLWILFMTSQTPGRPVFFDACGNASERLFRICGILALGCAAILVCSVACVRASDDRERREDARLSICWCLGGLAIMAIQTVAMICYEAFGGNPMAVQIGAAAGWIAAVVSAGAVVSAEHERQRLPKAGMQKRSLEK